MSINPAQFLNSIVRPTLQLLNEVDPGINSVAAEQLLFGTCLVESDFGTYLKQVRGPALGVYQMEPRTHDDLWETYLNSRGALASVIWGMAPQLLAEEPETGDPSSESLVVSLWYATAMTRVFYRRVQEALPAAGDLAGQAQYWKRYYNTRLGKGDPNVYRARFEKAFPRAKGLWV